MDSEQLMNKVIDWWNPMRPYDRQYYVWLHEGASVPMAALTDGAIIRLYLKVHENLTNAQALKKYQEIFSK